ncbi:unnamed protein product [Rodentolepis nana]|uniref:Endo/exonuclease/phosphatase domain-containing protein n=1 Tax=Rodentolepis nana TaxID=102285 RepID=A0A0R3T8C6_RODNA|nr:unnamed protein product [Rodentolepis nana]
MSPDKKIQVQKILQIYDVDILIIMEVNISDDKLKYYQFPGYTLYLLRKYRQVASGILTGVKEGLTSHYDLIKSMGLSQDKCEIIRLNIWKCQDHFKIYAVYNPPQNCPNFDYLNISHKIVVLGDFNAHSTRWGYKYTKIDGKEIEDMVNSNPLELIYSNEDPATYFHYNGTRTTPDLLLASSDISEHTRRKIIDHPDSGHKQVIARTEKKSGRPTKQLEDLKRKPEALRNTADQTGRTDDVQAWRHQSTALRQAILQANGLLSTTPKKNAEERIESALNCVTQLLANWYDNNGMQSTPRKLRCKNCFARHSINLLLRYKDTTIEKTYEFTYLGMTFDTKLKWKSHIAKMAERTSNRLNVLKRLAGGNGEDPPDVKPTGGNGEDPSDSLQEKMEKTHLIRCSKEEMEKTHLIRCLAINPHALYVTYRRKSGEAPSQIRRGNGEDLPDLVFSAQDKDENPKILGSKKTANELC